MARERVVIAKIDPVNKSVVLSTEELNLAFPQTFDVRGGERLVWKLADASGERRLFAARVSFDAPPGKVPLFKKRSVFTADGDTITSDPVNPDAPALKTEDDPIEYRYRFELDILGTFDALDCFWEGGPGTQLARTGMGGGVKSGGPGG